MKKPSILFTVIGILAALLIGFLIGISIDFPKVNNEQLAGTIGKANNYRNVTITDDDIQLRSNLLADTSLQKAYVEYFAFHYATAAELTETLDLAIVASENLKDFKNAGARVISGLKRYRSNIDRLRADLLIAITAIMNIEKMDAASITEVLNNANVALSRLSYNDDAVIAFIDESAMYLTGKTGNEALMLRKAHDKLMLLQVAKAMVMNDKPKLKYLDGKEFFASSEKLGFLNIESLNGIIWFDRENLNVVNSAEQLGIILSQEQLAFFSNENFKSVADQLSAGFPSFEQLGIYLNSERLGGFFNVEKLNTLWNNENLGVIFNVEQLGAIRY